MTQKTDALPHCPECGQALHPRGLLVVVSEADEIDESIPDGIPMGEPSGDVFSGLYCSPDCILDALDRGWPEYRCMI